MDDLQPVVEADEVGQRAPGTNGTPTASSVVSAPHTLSALWRPISGRSLTTMSPRATEPSSVTCQPGSTPNVNTSASPRGAAMTSGAVAFRTQRSTPGSASSRSLSRR